MITRVEEKIKCVLYSIFKVIYPQVMLQKSYLGFQIEIKDYSFLILLLALGGADGLPQPQRILVQAMSPRTLRGDVSKDPFRRRTKYLREILGLFAPPDVRLTSELRSNS